MLATPGTFPGLDNPHYREHDEKALAMLRHMIEGVSAELPESTINELRESATILFGSAWLSQTRKIPRPPQFRIKLCIVQFIQLSKKLLRRSIKANPSIVESKRLLPRKKR